MKKIKQFLKNNYRMIIIYSLIIIVLYIPLPYHIYAPGGIVDINKRVEISDSYKTKGSFNLSYVSEYKGNVFSVMVALIRKDWDILSNKDIVLDNETIKDYNLRDKILLQESYSNAILVAYQKAHKKVKITKSKVYVAFKFEQSKTNLKVGDEILSIDDIEVKDLNHLSKILKKYKKGAKITIKVDNNNHQYKRVATLIKYEGKTIIGVAISQVNEFETEPKIKLSYDKDEYGSSGGLMTALNIYNSITKKDITKGKTIVGTGTITSSGKVGKIDGVKYKIKGASKKKIDLFIVPNSNLKEALKVKRKNKYKFDIIGVDNFDEAIDYLKKH